MPDLLFAVDPGVALARLIKSIYKVTHYVSLLFAGYNAEGQTIQK